MECYLLYMCIDVCIHIYKNIYTIGRIQKMKGVSWKKNKKDVIWSMN